MKFTESPMCKSGSYCVVCRDFDGGRTWRSGALRMYPEVMVDFECPQAKPWVGVKPKPEQAQRQERTRTRTYGGGGVVTREQVLERHQMGTLAMDHADAIEAVLGKHPIVEVIRTALADVKNPSGCTKCRLNRTKQRVGGLVYKQDDATVAQIIAITGLKAP